MYMYMYIVPLFVFVSRYLSPFFFCFLNDSNHAYAYPLCARNHPWIDYKTVWIYCRILSSIDLLERNFAIRYICLLEVNYLNRETMLRRFQLYSTVYSLMSSDKWNSTIRLKILRQKIEVKLATIDSPIINLEYIYKSHIF